MTMDDMKNIITEATILVGEIPDDGTEGIGAPLRRGIDALRARVAELENENRILKNEVDDLRSFAKLNTDHAKNILGVHSK